MKQGVERRLFVAATSQNDGKTTCTLGLITSFRQRAASVGFIKPIGQRYVRVDGMEIDEDSVLVQKVCGLDCPLKDMSPVAVERSFTRRFLNDPDGLLPGLEESILRSFAVAAADNDLVVIEGTGHAGVGDVFDLCNARVAQMLDAKAIIVTRGGIGRPVDEVALNRSLFERAGVPVIGVIANKVQRQKLGQTSEYLSKALSRKGLSLLGVLPYMPRLTWPTVQDIVESLGAEVLNGSGSLDNTVANILVGAMTPHNFLRRAADKSLIIVPGDRDDLVLAALSAGLLREDLQVAGIVLTGGLKLAPSTMELVGRTQIPVLAVTDPTYDAAAEVHDTVVKIRATEDEKIQMAMSLVRDYVDLDRLWQAL